MKRLFLILSCTFWFSVAGAQTKDTQAENTGLINWMSFPEAEAAFNKQPRPVMINVYTDWCGWCKKMMATTFSNPTIAEYINVNFYPVRLNAETKDSITFLGKTYTNKGTGPRGAHELAVELLGGKMGYPTVVFFNSNFQFKLLVPGYLDVRDIEPVLIYTTEYIFNTTAVDDFRKNYFLASTPDSMRADTARVKWLSMQQAIKQSGSHSKKTLVFLNTQWSNSGRVMANGTFRDSTVVSYLHKNFTPVYFRADSKDTIQYKGVEYTNDGTYGAFHKLAVNLSNQKLTIPSMIIMDSEMNVITQVPQYFSPSDMHIILHFFAEDAYKTTKWEDYKKNFK